MPSVEVVAPRLSANEEDCAIIEVGVEPGDRVKAGDVLFILETAKSSLEILAPVAGEISTVEVQAGQSTVVGSVLCVIDQEAPLRTTSPELGRANPRVDGVMGQGQGGASTEKARLRAAAARLTTARAVILGGGGHGASLIDALQGSGWDIVGVLDGGLPPGFVVAGGVTVIGDDARLDELMADGVRTAFIGVGGSTDPTVRRKIYRDLDQRGFHLPPVVHRSAHVGVDVKLGPATYVLPGAVIGPRCRIGANVIVNSGSIVCHDSRVEDHAHITPGAILAGTVQVGEGSVVGMAATVLFGSSIGRGTVIHNNASVVSDIEDQVQLTRTGKRHPNP